MSIPINDISPRTQITAGALQTVFIYPFPIFANTDLRVYQTPAGQAGNDVNDILTLNVDYTVTGVGAANGGTIVLTVGTAINDIVTIVRDMPEDRMNLYLNGGLFTAVAVNDDFSRDVMMNQQNEMREAVLTPHYYNSAQVSLGANTRDQLLPILAPSTSWVMNGAGTQIEAVAFAGGGGGAPVVLPSVINSIATFTNTVGTIHSSIFLIPTADGNNGDSVTTNGAGQLQMSTVPGRNRLYNGNMQVWQRGAGGTATFAIAGGTNAYTADRWQFVAGAATNMTVSQQAGSTSGSFRARIQRDAAGAGVAAPTFAQSLPRSSGLGSAGRFITLSFRALRGANFSAAGNLLTANIITGTGVVDVSAITTGFAGQAVAATNTFALTTVETTYTLTTAVALAANITQLAVSFSYVPVGVAGANDWFEITDVQLESSLTKTPFENLDFNQQMIQCLSFYKKSFSYGTLPAQNVGTVTGEFVFPATVAGANVNRSQSIFYGIPLRAPANVIALYNPAAANNQARDETAAADCSLTNPLGNHQNGFYITTTANAGSAVGNILGIHWAADAELV